MDGGRMAGLERREEGKETEDRGAEEKSVC